MSNYKPRIESNNLDLTSILSTINALPEAGKGIVSQKFKNASLNITSDEVTGAVNISDCEFLGASSIGFESKNTGSFIVANCAFQDTSLALFGDGNFTFIGCEFWNCTKEYISDTANAALISGGNMWDGEPYS